MGMKMGLVQMGGDHRLIAVSQQALGQLHPNGVGLVRRHLAGGKGLDDVVALPLAPLFAPAPLGVQHILVHPVPGAVDGRLIADALRLCPVQGVVDGGLQRGFIWILRVAHAFVQPVMDG